MKFRWLGLGALAAIGVVSGCATASPAPDDEDVDRSAQAIQGGATDTTHKFAVGVCLGGSPGNCYGTCSGALIAPNVVVTARHCVSESPEIVDCSRNPTFGGASFNAFYVTTDVSTRQASKGWHSVKAIKVPSDNHVCGNDIAVLILNDLVKSTEAKPIVPGVQYPMNKKGYSRSFTAIGYGLTSTSQSADDSGTRRIKQNISILCIPKVPLLNCPKEIPEREFVGGDGVCQGDSGSSAYESSSFDAAGGESSISFGVLSRGGQDGNKCVGSIYTRLDAFRDLIVGTVEEASNDWSLYPKPSPDWTVYVPPETPDAGTSKDAGSKSPRAEFGETCTKNTDCESGTCATAEDASRFCSESCKGGDDSCPDGYACDGKVCQLQAATEDGADTPTTTTTTTTTGCSTGGRSTSNAGLAIAAMLGLTAAERRRRRKNLVQS